MEKEALQAGSVAVTNKNAKVVGVKKGRKVVKKTIEKKKPVKKSKPKSGSKILSGYQLVIVESPSKAKTIKKYLGRDYQVIASNGHIKDLPKSKLGVDVKNNFAIDLVPITNKKDKIEKIQSMAKNADKIYLAPDPDREGEAIAFHLHEEIGRKRNVFRVLFNAVTKKNVRDAIDNPQELDVRKYDSQRTRRILDRLVGYKISPILWDKVQRGLSAGRVQSVALRIIVEREDEVRAFKSEQWFSIHALMSKDDKEFKATYYGDSPDKKVDLNEIKTVEQILKKVKNQPFKTIEVKKKERRQSPTPPFTTSKLQQEAANKLGFTAKRTMSVAQRLYEGINLQSHGLQGLITYMRTDSVRIEPEALEALRKYIGQKYGTEFLSSSPIVYTKKKGGKIQDAHEAIRPANLDFPPELVKDDLASDEFRLYQMIWNKFVSSQMSHAVIDQTAVVFECQGIFFKSTGSIVKFPGFRTVYLESAIENAKAKDENFEIAGNKGDNILPEISEGEILRPKTNPESLEHWTSPPPRYNEASLVKELEERLDSQSNTISNTKIEAEKIPETKIITQTIKVDNPELQVKIDSLLKENEQLRTQVKELALQLKKLQNQNMLGDNSVAPLTIDVAESYSLIQNDGNGLFYMHFIAQTDKGDVYIPYTTTDSSGSSGKVGINYKVEGNNFSGYQSSKIICYAMKVIGSNKYCVVGSGQKTDIEVSVYINPDVAGNYSVTFEKINYWSGSEDKYSAQYIGDRDKLDSLYLR